MASDGKAGGEGAGPKLSNHSQQALDALNAELLKSRTDDRALLQGIGTGPSAKPFYADWEKNPPLFYFTWKFREYYGDDMVKVPFVRDRVNGFLKFIESNPNLLPDFGTALASNEVDISDINFRMYGDEVGMMMLYVFAGWAATKYAESFLAEKMGIKAPYKATIKVEKGRLPPKDEVHRLLYDTPTAFTTMGNRIDFLLMDGFRLEQYIDQSMHEWMHAAFLLKEEAPSLISSIMLPKKFSLESISEDFGWRNFYNSYVGTKEAVEKWAAWFDAQPNAKKENPSEQVQLAIDFLYHEYLMNSLDPWLSKYSNALGILGNQGKEKRSSWEGFDWIFMSGDKFWREEKVQSPQALAEEICGQLKIADPRVKSKLELVIAEMRALDERLEDELPHSLPSDALRNKIRNRSKWEKIKKFVELMNGAFGEPGPTVPGYGLLDANEKNGKTSA
ncbi:MAG: hypothetical protein WC717_02680 [Candidatus Micrarchaeia archaeon]